MALPQPIVVGLTICRDVLVEPTSGNYSVIRAFSGMPVAAFPGLGEPFRVFAALTGGHGEAEVELVVTWFGDEEIERYARLRHRIQFTDPLRVVQCVFRFDRFPFPGPGDYLFTLYLGGGWAAQRSLRVYVREDKS